MGKLILPDTNILVLAVGGEEPCASFLKKQIEEKKLIFSVVVVAEFLSKATPEEERIVSELFSKFEVLPVDLAVAQLTAYYRKVYAQKGYRLKLADCLIAATARIYNLQLATLDKSGYPMKDIELLDRF